MAPHEIEQIATAVGAAVGKAVVDGFSSVVIPTMEAVRGDVAALRSDAFKAMEGKVSRDECTRTHAALPPVTILMAIGGSSVVTSVVTGIAVYAITRG